MKKLVFALFLALALISIPQGARATVVADDAGDRYVANGATTAFAYNFKILSSGDIRVLVDGTLQTLTTHYTVSGVGNSAGGTVTFVTAPANTLAVTLLRNQSIAQGTNYTANEVYNPTRVMQDLDKQAMIDQMQAEQLARTPKLPEKSTLSSITFPDGTGNGSKWIRWNSGGTALEASDELGVVAHTEDGVPVGNGTSFDVKVLPSCSDATTSKVLYNSSTNTFTCGTDQTTAPGTGIVSLNTLSGGTQTFSRTNDTNVTMTLTPSGTDHNFALGWTGSLAIARGGTGQTTQTAAFNGLDPLTTKGDLLSHDGTDSIRFAACGNGVGIVADSTQTSGWKCDTTRPVMTLVVKSADEALQNNTIQNDDHLLFSCAANTSYKFELRLLLNATSGTPDFKFGWSVPASATMFWGAYDKTTSGWMTESAGSVPSVLYTESQTMTAASVNGTTGAQITAIVRCAGTAGAVNFQWAQNTTTAADSKVLKDSSLLVTKLQ